MAQLPVDFDGSCPMYFRGEDWSFSTKTQKHDGGLSSSSSSGVYVLLHKGKPVVKLPSFTFSENWDDCGGGGFVGMDDLRVELRGDRLWVFGREQPSCETREVCAVRLVGSAVVLLGEKKRQVRDSVAVRLSGVCTRDLLALADHRKLGVVRPEGLSLCVDGFTGQRAFANGFYKMCESQACSKPTFRHCSHDMLLVSFREEPFKGWFLSLSLHARGEQHWSSIADATAEWPPTHGWRVPFDRIADKDVCMERYTTCSVEEAPQSGDDHSSTVEQSFDVTEYKDASQAEFLVSEWSFQAVTKESEEGMYSSSSSGVYALMHCERLVAELPSFTFSSISDECGGGSYTVMEDLSVRLCGNVLWASGMPTDSKDYLQAPVLRLVGNPADDKHRRLLALVKQCQKISDPSLLSELQRRGCAPAAPPETEVLAAFRQFDKNGDGGIEKEELRNALNSLDEAWSASRCDDLFDALDRNKDGFIQYEEFITWVFGAGSDANQSDFRAALDVLASEASELQTE